MQNANRRLVRRVLVAVEPGSPASALDAADQLARAFDAKLSAIQVMPRETMPAAALGASDALAQKLADDTNRARSAVGTAVRCDDATAGILKQAAAEGADLLVIGTHERQGLDRWQSVSAAVMRDAGCSVLVSRSSSPTRGPVLVACDLGPDTPAVLTMAGAFSTTLNEQLVAMHVVEPNRHDLALVTTAVFSGVVAPPANNHADAAYRGAAEAALHTELAAAGVDARPELAAGKAARTVVERARELHASLIVVGSHQRKGLARVVLGSVAEAIARDAPCSVLIVHIPEATELSEQSVERKDRRSAHTAELIEGAVGAVAGAAAGIVAGPIGVLAGGALGAVAAVALGTKTEADDHEAALRVRTLDAVDAEKAFFEADDDAPDTRRYH